MRKSDDEEGVVMERNDDAVGTVLMEWEKITFGGRLWCGGLHLCSCKVDGGS